MRSTHRGIEITEHERRVLQKRITSRNTQEGFKDDPEVGKLVQGLSDSVDKLTKKVEKLEKELRGYSTAMDNIRKRLIDLEFARMPGPEDVETR